MTEAEHTPGPWQVSPNDAATVTDSKSEFVAYVAVKVDARFIAAAPDMEKALEILLDSHSGMSNRNCSCDECAPAKAALAKAKGVANA